MKHIDKKAKKSEIYGVDRTLTSADREGCGGPPLGGTPPRSAASVGVFGGFASFGSSRNVAEEFGKAAA